MKEVIANLLEKIEYLDALLIMNRDAYAQGRRDALMETLTELVKAYERRNDERKV